ncbi:MAG TPA: hypothetical protein H9955_08890 [Candidatus Mediterraneibacter cottocaccae]|nr:hypothetical protein [Candidatus Mediterraneibacter cottocaccae]
MAAGEIISLTIAVLGFLASVYYSNKNSKKQDMDEAVKRAEENAKISTKLDNIASDVRDTARSVDKLREEIAEHGNRIVAVEQSTKSAHHRIDELIKLHNKYCGTEEPYRERKEEQPWNRS